MEPLFFKAENALHRRQVSHGVGASMEPLFFKAENAKPKPKSRNCWRLLQWSRFFSKRKIFTPTALRSMHSLASMEPLFFKAENDARSLPPASLGDTLQWSRFFSKRKITGVQGDRLPLPVCFNGAAFFQSGKCLRFGEVGKGSRRFNGAAFFQSGKSRWHRARHRASGNASMEPLFFKAENLARA